MASLEGKKIMVTAGGTREYIDDVRVVTNISSGALGAKIAEGLYEAGARVFYLHGKGSVLPTCIPGLSETGRLMTDQFVTCADLKDSMYSLCHGMGMDAVIHSAAVSDFTFRRDLPMKLSSSDEEGFIEHMRQAIMPNPKIIMDIKKPAWCPETILVGFKFTVGKTYRELMDIAYESGVKCKADLMVANDKEDMKRARSHLAYIIDIEAGWNAMYSPKNKNEISRTLLDALVYKFTCREALL